MFREMDFLIKSQRAVEKDASFLDAKENLCKMSLSKFFQEGVLLQETTRLPTLWVSENESSLVQHRNLILILELPSFVSTDDSFIDESAITW